MRDYEFRGKRIDNGEWVYGYYVENKLGNHFIYESERNGEFVWNIYEVDPSTIGQFTGLVDKKKVKIYEGDVVCTPFIDPIFGDMMDKEIYYEQKWMVTFKDGSFIVDNGDRLIYLWAFSQNGNVEVVGNIHDKGEKLCINEQIQTEQQHLLLNNPT